MQMVVDIPKQRKGQKLKEYLNLGHFGDRIYQTPFAVVTAASVAQHGRPVPFTDWVDREHPFNRPYPADGRLNASASSP